MGLKTHSVMIPDSELIRIDLLSIKVIVRTFISMTQRMERLYYFVKNLFNSKMGETSVRSQLIWSEENRRVRVQIILGDFQNAQRICDYLQGDIPITGLWYKIPTQPKSLTPLNAKTTRLQNSRSAF